MASSTVRKKTAAEGKKSASAGRKTPAAGKGASTAGKKASAAGSRRSSEKAAATVSKKAKQALSQDQGEAVSTGSPFLREVVLWLIFALCIFVFISYFGAGGFLGSTISDICFGIFGICAYLFPLLLFLAAAFSISNRGSRLAGVKFGASIVLYLSICSFAALFEGKYQGPYQVTELYLRCASGKSGGGVVGGTICSLLAPALGAVGTGVILTVLLLICFVLITQKSLLRGMRSQSRRVYESARESSVRRKEEKKSRKDWERFEAESGLEDVTGLAEGRQKRRHEPVPSPEPYGRRTASSERADSDKVRPFEHPGKAGREIDVSVMFPSQRTARKPRRRVSGVTRDTQITGGTRPVGAEIHEIMPKMSSRAAAEEETLQEDRTCFIDLEQPGSAADAGSEDPETISQAFRSLPIEGFEDVQDKEPNGQEEENGRQEEELDGQEYADVRPKKADGSRNASEKRRRDADTDEKTETPETPEGASLEHAASAAKPKRNPRSSEQEIADGIASVEAEMAEAGKALRREYVFPPLELLKEGKNRAKRGQEQEIRQTAVKLQQTLNSFGVRVKVTNVSCGPAVTRYELLPEQGVKVSRIVSLSDDIKLNLAAADIRIEAPIPGKSAVGIEVPNAENSAVALRELLESEEFRNHPSKLAFATGKDIGGKVVVSDIAKMPHLLIAGATGSGKSVCINTLIMSILYKARPEEVKLIMIDPKVVELSVYNGIPHLFIPVVTDPKKAAGALNWGVAEMEDRYNKFAEAGVRDLKGYNQKIEAARKALEKDKKEQEEEGAEDGDKLPEKLPQIVIIVDELADLMMVAPGEVEDSICRLAQLARAAGIHLVIATQRPSVNVITGLIKANMPSRIAFSVSSGVDSRTIIDMYGAEKLLGKGDMLFYPQGYQKPARVQGAFVSDEEVADVVDFLKHSNGFDGYNEKMEEQIAKVQQAASASRAAEDTDELFADAGKFIIEKDKASIGMLQRVFKIGFNRAARIMDQLSDAGVVGPEEGTKPRKILMSAEEFENYLEQN